MSDVGSSPLLLARHFVEIGRHERALEALERHEDLSDPEVWALRGEALYHLDRYTEGAVAARSGLALEPNHPTLLDVLALNLLETGDLAGAERALLAALEAWPDDPTLLGHYALACARGGQEAKAVALVARAAAVDPESVDVLRVRAQVAFLTGDRGAQRYADELLAAAPEDRTGHVLRANALVQQRRVHAAVPHMEHAVRLDPTDHDTARVTRQNRVVTHWTQWPLYPIQRFGVMAVWVAFVLTLLLTAALDQEWLLVVVVPVYLFLVLYSWTIGPLTRWWLRRKLR